MNTPKIPENMTPNSHRRKKREHSTPKADGAPKLPIWLDDDSKKWFSKIKRELGAIAKLNDSLALALLTDAIVDYIQIKQIIRTEGRTKSGRDGGEIKHPLSSELKDARATVFAILKEFGCTPVSRARIAVSIENDKDGFLDDV